MPKFIKGLALARAFYHQAVQPILAAQFPKLRYSAGLMGGGSEVLGYDTAMSTDHHWGPRLMLFLSAADQRGQGAAISAALSRKLPYRFMGYSTHFSKPKTDADDTGTQLLEDIRQGPINHRVENLTLDQFMRHHLGIAAAHPMKPADWLSIPQQKLLSFIAGELFRDDLGIAAVRQRFSYYPHDVWLYLLACGWSRISQDEHLAPRAGAAGDELGSALIAARLVRSIIQLCFLMEKRYAPYPKWLGTGFAELACAKALAPILRDIQTGADYQMRERRLCAAYEMLNRQHNALHLTAPIRPAVKPFHKRGFMVSQGWRYSQALTAAISDDNVKRIAASAQIGSIDQFSDNTDLREGAHLRPKIAALYDDSQAE